jgi:hypothetical protein
LSPGPFRGGGSSFYAGRATSATANVAPEAGIIPRAIERIFERAARLRLDGWQYSVTCTFVEVYNDQIRNLLDPRPEYHAPFLHLQQGGARPQTQHDVVLDERGVPYVSNLPQTTVQTPADVHRLLDIAARNRAVARTLLNDRSSRSHCVFTLTIRGVSTRIQQSSEGVLCLVDLAGSERINESGVDGQQKKEAIAINRSLMHLSDCIHSLDSASRPGGRAVVSWRNSKLTHMLQRYMEGDGAKMLMLVTVSPREEFAAETTNSLRFAAKVNVTQIAAAKKQVHAL